VSPAAEAQEAYLDAWRAVGRILGIEPALLPDDLAEARTLTDTIHRRQIAPSKEGRLMTTALLDMLEENIPAPPFKGVAGSLMRRFLPSEVADGLGVPSHALDDRLARLFADVTGDLDTALLASRRLSVGLLQWMVTVDRGGKRTPFHVPKTLHDNWGLAPGAHEASFWHNVASWLVS